MSKNEPRFRKSKKMVSNFKMVKKMNMMPLSRLNFQMWKKKSLKKYQILYKLYLSNQNLSVPDMCINLTFCQKNFQNLVAIFWSQTAFTSNVFRWKMKNYGLSECKIWYTQLLCFSFRKFCKNKFFKFDLIFFENIFMKFRGTF